MGAYTRFEMRGTGEGIFTVLQDLCCEWDYRPIIRRRDRDDFVRARRWLFANTVAPYDDVYAWDRRHGPIPRSWWQPWAAEHIACCWRLCVILNRNGVPLRPLRSKKRLGMVRFENDVEIVMVVPQRAYRKIARERPTRPRRQLPKDHPWFGDRATIRRPETIGRGDHIYEKRRDRERARRALELRELDRMG